MNKNVGEVDRVRQYTDPAVLAKIDAAIQTNIQRYSASREGLDVRIQDLQREWSMERYLEQNAAALGFTSAFLGLTASRKYLLITLAVTGFLFQHAIQGWCPPVALFRKMGIRTRGEIDRELYALKAIRGDFDAVVKSAPAAEPARAAMASAALANS